MTWSCPTPLEGIQFRSRLEARWYLFFKFLGVDVQYEPKCFTIDGGVAYKPDFRVAAQLRFPIEWWFEVKPFTGSDLTKPELFSYTLAKDIGVLTDLPRCDADDDLCKFTILSGSGGDSDYAFCECGHCGAFGFAWEGLADRIGCNCSDECRPGFFSNRIVEAYAGALDAKFPKIPPVFPESPISRNSET